MAYKRLIALVAVDGLKVVKTYGFSFRRPGGHLLSLLRELDSWNIDEIAIVDVSRRGRIADDLLPVLSKAELRTPLTYGGGIRTVADVRPLLDCGIDRFIFETLFLHSPEQLEPIFGLVGGQAMILSLPLIRAKGTTEILHFPAPSVELPNPVAKPISSISDIVRESAFSELLVIDRNSEGFPGGFNIVSKNGESSLDVFAKRIVWFGGINADIANRLVHLEETAGIAFGKQLLEGEAVLPYLREEIIRDAQDSTIIRSP